MQTIRILTLSVVLLCAFGRPASSQIAQEAWSPGSSSILEVEVMPPAYRGAWAPERADCEDEDGVNRIQVFAAGLDTYESGGRVQRVTGAGQARAIKVKVSYEGEGNFWERVETWTLNVEGDQLTIREDGAGSSTRLVRCS